MTFAVAKKLALAALTVVAVYIWWGNIGAYFSAGPSDSAPSIASSSSATVPKAKTQPGQLAYLGVKINPFRRNLQSAPQPQRPTPQRHEPPPSPLSATAALTGIIARGEASQAVICINDNRTFVLTANDSLAGWELNQLSDDFVVFSQGKYRDTLRLGLTIQ